jgi:hypothetical protein
MPNLFFEIQGWVLSKEFKGIQLPKAHVAQGLGLGFQYAISEFSRCIWTTMFEKRLLSFCRDNIIWWASSAFFVENPRYNYKAYSSAYTDAWESDTNIKYLRYAEVLLMKALNELGKLQSNSFVKPD